MALYRRGEVLDTLRIGLLLLRCIGERALVAFHGIFEADERMVNGRILHIPTRYELGLKEDILLYDFRRAASRKRSIVHY